MKKLLVVGFYWWALVTPLRSVAGPPDIVVVRIRDGGDTIQVIITRAEGKSEKLEFPSGISDKNLTLSSEGYYKLFQQLYQDGYKLQSTFNNVDVFTTLLFVRDK